MSAQDCLPGTYVWTEKPSKQILKRKFKFILSIVQFVWILRLPISLYWLLEMHMSQAAFLSARLFTWHVCMNQKPSQQIFKYILSTAHFGRILGLSISVYWLLIPVSQAAFLSTRLSTCHICNNKEVIAMNVITTKSENFAKRLRVIMKPRSGPSWAKFLGTPLTYPRPTGIPEVS